MGKMSFTISNFICNECGMSFPLPRKNTHIRERGHIKDIYCPKCNKITKFREIRDCDFIDGIFDAKGKVG